MAKPSNVATRLSRYAALPIALLLLSATQAHALDPRCGDRTATGTIVCIIDQPVVTQHETTYPSVQFAPKDVVDILADGCVQTGGLGDTWKRYVNPTGGDIDKYYHGLIRIPTAVPGGSGLTRIEKFAHRQTVSGTGLPLSELVLHLGYEDDGYADNGYYRHDNGNDDQCNNDNGHGGPARVIITIYRGVKPSGQVSRFDFDVLSDNLDINNLPYNPNWAWQRSSGNTGRTPDTSTCHNFSKRDPFDQVPAPHLDPNFPDCTDQADTNSVDLPLVGSINWWACIGWAAISRADSFPGHVNWFPVTLEGHAAWQEEHIDDDNSFTFTSDNPGSPLGVNGQTGLHVEFDSDETTKLFGSPEWTSFHNWVNTNEDTLARQMFDGHTIATGMFGLDGEHGLKSELHPLYAMATRRDNYGFDATHQDWLIFVRNRGDEGYCSSRLWDAGFEDYTFQLPWLAGMASVAVNWDESPFEGTPGTSGPTIAMSPPSTDGPPAGVYVTFHLGPASSAPFIDGSLKLVWTAGTNLVGPPVAPGRVARRDLSHLGDAVVIGRAVEADEVETHLAAAIAPLTPAQRQTVRLSRTMAIARPTLHRLPPGIIVRDVPVRPPVARIGRRHAIAAGPATTKLQRDAAQMQALCAVTHNAPANLPRNLCVTTVRDHR